jgi:hypothetical protein
MSLGPAVGWHGILLGLQAWATSTQIWVKPFLKPELPPRTFCPMIHQIPFVLKLVCCIFCSLTEKGLPDISDHCNLI